MSKYRQPKVDNKSYEVIECCTQLHKNEHPNEVEMERMDTIANTHTIQPPGQTNIECG